MQFRYADEEPGRNEIRRAFEMLRFNATCVTLYHVPRYLTRSRAPFGPDADALDPGADGNLSFICNYNRASRCISRYRGDPRTRDDNASCVAISIGNTEGDLARETRFGCAHLGNSACVLSLPLASLLSRPPRENIHAPRHQEDFIATRGSFQSDYAGEPGEPPIIQSRFIAATDKADYLSLAVFTILNTREREGLVFGGFSPRS